MNGNERFRGALGLLTLLAMFAGGIVLGRQCIGGSPDESALLHADNFGSRAARFDEVRYTGTYLLTPYSDSLLTPRDESPGGARSSTRTAQQIGPSVVVVWYRDGNQHNRFQFREDDAGMGELNAFEDGRAVVLCSTRDSDLREMGSTGAGLCFEVGDFGGVGAEFDRGDLAVLSTLEVAGETAHCHGSGESVGNCYADDGVLLYSSSIGFPTVLVGLDASFRAGGLVLFGEDSPLQYELRATSIRRNVDASAFDPPFDVRAFPGFAELDCPTAPGTGVTGTFGEACVRSLVTFPFRWPRLLDDYVEPAVEVTSGEAFTATYIPRLPRLRSWFLISFAAHYAGHDPWDYGPISTEVYGDVTVTFRNSPIQVSSLPTTREAAWSDGVTDYVLTVNANGSEDRDEALHRIARLVIENMPPSLSSPTQ